MMVNRNILEWAAEMPCEMEADDEGDYDPAVCSKHHTGRCWPCEARVWLSGSRSNPAQPVESADGGSAGSGLGAGGPGAHDPQSSG